MFYVTIKWPDEAGEGLSSRFTRHMWSLTCEKCGAEISGVRIPASDLRVTDPSAEHIDMYRHGPRVFPLPVARDAKDPTADTGPAPSTGDIMLAMLEHTTNCGCQHTDTERGRDAPRRYGSYRTVVCNACGAFRLIDHIGTSVGTWRSPAEYDEATANREPK